MDKKKNEVKEETKKEEKKAATKKTDKVEKKVANKNENKNSETKTTKIVKSESKEKVKVEEKEENKKEEVVKDKEETTVKNNKANDINYDLKADEIFDKNPPSKKNIVFAVVGVVLVIALVVGASFIINKGNKTKNHQKLIDKVGDLSLVLKGVQPQPFFDGHAIVSVDDKQYIIDTAGKIVSDGYDEVTYLEDYYLLCNNVIGSHCALADKDGKLLFDLKEYDSIYNYGDFLFAEKDGKFAIIDEKGEPVTDFVYTDLSGASKELAFLTSKSDGIVGVTADGNVKLKLDYDNIYAAEKEFNSFVAEKDEKFGLIDANGKEILDAKYDDFDVINYDDKTFFLVVKGDKQGLIDTSGKVLIDTKYDYIVTYADGYAGVCNIDENVTDYSSYHCGIVDTNDKIIVPLDYNYAFPYDKDHLLVGKYANSAWQYGLLNNKGKEIHEVKYENLIYVEDGVSVIIENDKYVLINDKGKKISDEYDQIAYFNDGYFTVIKDGKFGFIDLDGNVVGDGCIYKEASVFSEGLAAVKLNDGWAYINIKGKTIIGDLNYVRVKQPPKSVLWTEEDKNESKKVNVYVFYGKGCPHCAELKEWITSSDVIKKYGKYFRIVAYEVWNNEDNSDLMYEVSDFLEDDADGVPYMIIGDQSFSGYASDMNEEIINKIMSEYKKDVDDRYDIIQKVNEE